MSSPISGFTAIPNPQMLAFMPIQSYLMMYFAGSAWQFGKRKISAMSNEDFNKTTMEDMLHQHSIELKNVLPTLEKSLQDVTPLVRILIEQYGDFIKEALKAIPQAAANAGIPILQGEEKIAYDKAFFDWLKGTPESNIPDFLKAQARLGPGVPSAGTINPITQKTLQDKERLAQAVARIEAFKIQAAADKASAKLAAASPKISTVHQTAIQASRETTKRPAGQTQKIERARLTALILRQASTLKEAQANARRTTQGSQYSLTWNRRLREAQTAIQKTQTLLSGLVARYRF